MVWALSDGCASAKEWRAPRQRVVAPVRGDTSLAVFARARLTPALLFAARVISWLWVCLRLQRPDGQVQHPTTLFRAVALARKVWVVPLVAEFRLVRSLLDQFQLLHPAIGSVCFPAATTLQFIGDRFLPLKRVDTHHSLISLAARAVCLLPSLFPHLQLTELSSSVSQGRPSATPSHIQSGAAATSTASSAAGAEPLHQVPQTKPQESELQALRLILGEKEEMLQQERAHVQQLRAELLFTQVQCQQALHGAEEAAREKDALEVKLRIIFEALCQICTCPLTMQAMDEPVVAPDLRTYELAAIRTWLEEHRSSPFTRLPMCEASLRMNRTLLEVKELVSRHWPDSEVTSQPTEALPQLVGRELLNMMEDDEESAALELLARPVKDSTLNHLYKLEGSSYTLLQVALVYHQPRVACAVAARRDFRRISFSGPSGVTALHMAALLGYEELCKIIVEDQGQAALGRKSFADSVFTLESEEVVSIPSGSTPLSLLRSGGHHLLADHLEASQRSSPVPGQSHGVEEAGTFFSSLFSSWGQ